MAAGVLYPLFGLLLNPMIAAVGPRTIPRQPIEQTIEMMPMTSEAMARPSVRCAAYPYPAGA